MNLSDECKDATMISISKGLLRQLKGELRQFSFLSPEESFGRRYLTLDS